MVKFQEEYYRQIFLKIFTKNSKKHLDSGELFLYYEWARVRECYALDAATAMNREIARLRGNFRGVCPIIGRLRKDLYVA